MLACSRCGAENQDRAAVCSSCGKSLAAGAPGPAPGPDPERAATIVVGLAADPAAIPAGGDARELLGKIVNGKYEVLAVLGEGGMGIVYKVRHLLLPNRNIFALKVIHPRFSSNGSFQKRFLREVEIAMELTHENIIQIRDFGLTEQNLLFYTMDFSPGDTLKEILTRSGAMPPPRALGIVRQILLALAEAHKAGIVHRDMKPDNLLIQTLPNGADKVRILDFGIAKLLEDGGEESQATQHGAIGTPKYMSPEQASGARVDGRSDLYSLGVILYEMLVGRVPFSGGTARSILLSHLTVPPRRFKDARPDLSIPEKIEEIVFHLLEKEREARPASADEVLGFLGAGRSAWAGFTPEVRKRFPRWVGVALVALLAAAAAEHFLPWRQILSSQAEAEGDGSAAAEPPPRGASRAPAAPARAARARRLHCAVCAAEYAPGEKVGDMCHGEPLLEVE